MTSLGSTPFEAVDDAISLDVSGMGILPKLHRKIRKKIRDSPSKSAALAINKATDSKGRVLIVTGYPVPYPFSRTREIHSDGPIGAASLARSIFSGFGAKPTIMVDEGLGRIQSSIVNAIGISRNGITSVEEFPMKASESYSREVLDRINPCVIIASEKISRNSDGVYHTALGDNLSDFVSHIDGIFYEAIRRNVLTVGIGDFGNEIGLGLIRDALPSILPNSGRCKCGCPGGIAAFTETRYAMVGAMSDWGVYGLIAALALIVRDPRLLPDLNEVKLGMEAFAHETGLERGDQLMTDNIPISQTGNLLRDLKHIVEKTVAEGH